MLQNALQVTIRTSHDQLNALPSEQLIYLLLKVAPGETVQRRRAPLNISLVIDRSTSMRGSRLNQVKAAASLIIDKLSAGDTISIVTFSDRAQVVIPSQKVGNKVALVSRINSIIASGATEIYQGLQAGLRELRKQRIDEHVSHMILLTDGHTYGDSEQCLLLAKDAAEKGVSMSAFGLGTEWNDEFLDGLVAPSGGRSAFIESPQQIIAYLENQIEGLGMMFAQNVQLQYRFPTRVGIRFAFKVSPYVQPVPVEKNILKLGMLEGSTPVTCLLEIGVGPQELGSYLELPYQVSAELIGMENELARVTGKQVLAVVESASSPELDPELVQAVQALTYYRMNEKAWQDVEAGRLETATRRMEQLTKRLQGAGFRELAQQAANETRRLQQLGSMSDEGHKRLKYGTRRLLSGKLES